MSIQDTSASSVDSDADQVKTIDFLEKRLLAEALRDNDPSLVRSGGEDGEEYVSISAGILGDQDLPAVRLSELESWIQEEKQSRRGSWIGPGESLSSHQPQRATSSWMMEPGSPIKSSSGRDGEVLSPIGEDDDTDQSNLPALSMSATFASTMHIVMPQHANSAGVLFGGQLMGLFNAYLHRDYHHLTCLIRLDGEDCSHRRKSVQSRSLCLGNSRVIQSSLHVTIPILIFSTGSMDGLEFREAVAIGDMSVYGFNLT